MRSSLFAFAVAIGLAARGAGADPPPPDARAAAASAVRLVHLIGGTSEQVRRMLRQARAQKPPRLRSGENAARRVVCLDEALSRVDAALRTSRDEARLVHDAAERDDADAALAHLAKIARLREASRAAAAAGAACAAGLELEPFVEGTTVRVIVDPNVVRVSP